jgi:hypothetical protein
LIAALLLSACGPDGIVPQPPPVALSYVMMPGYEVECVETLVRINIPSALPIIMWGKRTFNCELRKKSTAVPERIMRDK